MSNIQPKCAHCGKFIPNKFLETGKSYHLMYDFDGNEHEHFECEKCFYENGL